jgi:hypothetical protein
MPGSYRASIGHNPKILVKKQSLSLAGKDITLTPASGGGTPVANFLIGTSAATFNGASAVPLGGGSARAVAAGEVVEFAAGTHVPITISNLLGTAANPITVRGPTTGVATIRKTGTLATGFIFTLKSCRYFTLDGATTDTGVALDTDGKRHNIKIMYSTGAGAGAKDTPTAWLKFNDSGGATYSGTRNCTIRYIRIDGGYPTFSNDGIGISTNSAGSLITSYPGVFQDGMLIEHNYISAAEGEGMYIGPEFVDGKLPLKNIEIRYNLVTDCGWDGIQGKNWWEGTNSMHHNIALRNGAAHVAAQETGIYLQSGTGDIYNNWSEGNSNDGLHMSVDNGPSATVSPGSGYPIYATFAVNVYNNVSILNGQSGFHVGGSGGATKPDVKTYNNTFVSNVGPGVDYTSAPTSGSWIRNNISLNNTGANVTPGSGSQSNNLTSGTPASVFVSPGAGNYHLLAAQAAVGTVGTDIAATDYDGDTRTTATADKGAYEYP